MPETDNDRVDEAVDQFLQYLEQRTTRPSLHRLSPEEQARARAIFRVLEDGWGIDTGAAPPLEDDPVARSLGLIPEAASVPVSGSAVRRARMSRALDIEQIAQALGSRWPMVDVQWMFRLEQTLSEDMDAALAQALAEELGATLDTLRATDAPRREDSLAIFLRSAVFTQRVERWAGQKNLDAQHEIKVIARELAGAARRSAGDPGVDFWTALLDALLRGRKS